MTTPNQVLDVARSLIGLGETPPGSNHNRITQWYGMDGPWCAMTVSYEFFTAGLPLAASTSKGFAYCPSGVDWFKRNGRWATSNPVPGDVIFFQFPGEESRPNHVGIVEAVNGQGIQTIEGNTDDMVRRRSRSAYIVGYGKPPYTAMTTQEAAKLLNKKVVGLLPMPTGDGYWVIAEDGGVFSYGSAQFYGSMGGQPLSAPIVAAAVHPSGTGYWLVGKDGGVFTFGEGKFFGSLAQSTLQQPVSGITPHPSGDGYWLVAEDGGVFAFGASKYYGSPSQKT